MGEAEACHDRIFSIAIGLPVWCRDMALWCPDRVGAGIGRLRSRQGFPIAMGSP